MTSIALMGLPILLLLAFALWQKRDVQFVVKSPFISFLLDARGDKGCLTDALRDSGEDKSK
jgi:hypothetical protein